MMYRFNDDYLKPDALNKVFNIASNEIIKDKRIQNYIIVLSRYLIRLKLEQQKISSLSTTSNETIKNSTKTLQVVKQSLENYGSLINGAETIIGAFPTLETNHNNQESLEKIATFTKLVSKYKNDKKRLQTLINSLEKYQQYALEKAPNNEQNSTNSFLHIISSLFFLLFLVFSVRKKNQ